MPKRVVSSPLQCGAWHIDLSWTWHATVNRRPGRSRSLTRRHVPPVHQWWVFWFHGNEIQHRRILNHQWQWTRHGFWQSMEQEQTQGDGDRGRTFWRLRGSVDFFWLPNLARLDFRFIRSTNTATYSSCYQPWNGNGFTTLVASSLGSVCASCLNKWEEVAC